MSELDKVEQKLVEILQRLRLLQPNLSETPNRSPQTSTALEDGFDGFPGRVLIGLRTKGCSWARNANGGCTHCSIAFSDMCQSQVSDDQILLQFIADIARYDFRKYPVLCVYTPGSFFDDKEISPYLRLMLLRTISRQHSMRKLVLESRPDLVSEEKASALRAALPNIELEVGLGVDSANDMIRKLCIHKCFNLKSYEKACKILRDLGISITAFVLVKPPFLSEHEAVKDALQSAKKAFDVGASTVSFEPMTVQKFTLTYYLHEIGLYRPPWLWSIIEIIKQSWHFGKLRVGQLTYPTPVDVPKNCSRCSSSFAERISSFNRTQRPELFEGISCSCKSEWEREVLVNGGDSLARSLALGLGRIVEYLEQCNRQEHIHILR